MSVFGGQLNFTGQPVEYAFLDRMGMLLARRGPDDQVTKTVGPMGLVFRAFGDALEDEVNSWLWESHDGSLLALAGRIDNSRHELAHVVGLNGRDATSLSSLLFAGLERFGAKSFIGRLYGDYELAYWNARTNELSLGRDSVGVGTLYYYRSPNALTFSSDLGALITALQIAPDLDDDYVAGFLTYGPEEGRTVYRNVSSVRPGGVVTCSQHGSLSIQTAWALAADPSPINYRDDREYEDHFRCLFADAVRVRMPNAGPVVAELSGGLDSTSVVCMADHLMKSGISQSSSLTTVSRIFDESQTTNETRFIEAASSHCGRPSLYIFESQVPNFFPSQDVARLHVPSPQIIRAGYDLAVASHLRQLGAKVLLSGVGGDEMFYSTSLPYPRLADLWSSGEFGRLHQETLLWSRALKRSYVSVTFRSFKLGVLRRYLPCGAMDWTGRQLPTWVHKRLWPRVRRQMVAGERLLRVYRRPSVQSHASAYYSAIRPIAAGYRQEFDPRRITFPCLHRPLVEFMHAIPFAQKLRCGQTRSVQRRALRPILPIAVVERRGKGNGLEANVRCLRAARPVWDRLLFDSQAGAREYIDVPRLQSLLKGVRAGGGIQEPWIAGLALEMWLAAHRADSRSPATSWVTERSIV